MNIPNALSLARLLAVPVFVWLVLDGEVQWAFWVFVAASISDAIDGAIAKYFNRATELGAFLDPLADKALLISAYVTLGISGQLPVWIVVLVVSRDILIIGGALVYLVVTGYLTMEPLLISKINTLTQALLAAAALAEPVFAMPGMAVVTFLLGAAAVTTMISGGAYVIIWSRRAEAAGQSAKTRKDERDT